MKILHTVHAYHPQSGGSEEVVRKISEYLVGWGYDVTVATTKNPERQIYKLNGVKIVDFNCRGNLVDGINGETGRYIDFIRTGGFDIMMNYHAHTWCTDLVLDLLPGLKMKKYFVPVGFSKLNDSRYADYFKRMPNVLRNYNHVIYLSDNYIDAKFAREHGLRNGIVIPNAADLTEFVNGQRGAFREKYSIGNKLLAVNISNHSTLKNHKFFWNCIKLLDRNVVTPVLIGNAFHTFPKKWLTECYAHCRALGIKHNVLMLEGIPRQEVVQALIDADVFIFGSKVECSPLVMFESFASKTLFITTDCGNVKDYDDVVCIVKNEEEVADIVKDFYLNPEKYSERIQKGYRYFIDRLNWESIAREYENLYMS